MFIPYFILAILIVAILSIISSVRLDGKPKNEASSLSLSLNNNDFKTIYTLILLLGLLFVHEQTSPSAKAFYLFGMLFLFRFVIRTDPK